MERHFRQSGPSGQPGPGRQTRQTSQKRELILEKAKQVFHRKGFAAVTMKDIIEECGISRGGIYLYFHSVDEIFIQVILEHNKQKLREAQEDAREERGFRRLLDEYFDKQKNRLMNMHDSLLMAMHEYRFSHKSEQDKEFYRQQFLSTKAILTELLSAGAAQGEIDSKDLDRLAVNIMYFIEGIGTMAVTGGVSEETIDAQIAFMKEVIYSRRGAGPA